MALLAMGAPRQGWPSVLWVSRSQGHRVRECGFHHLAGTCTSYLGSDWAAQTWGTGLGKTQSPEHLDCNTSFSQNVLSIRVQSLKGTRAPAIPWLRSRGAGLSGGRVDSPPRASGPGEMPRPGVGTQVTHLRGLQRGHQVRTRASGP